MYIPGSCMPDCKPSITTVPGISHLSAWCCDRMDSAWMSSRFPMHKIKLKELRSFSWRSARRLPACRVASRRAGAARIARVGVLRRCAGVFRRCPADACAPVKPFGTVLQTPVLVGSLGVVLCGPPERSLLSMCLWAPSSTTGDTARKPRGNRGRGDMET